MSDLKLCQGTKCHTYNTKDRLKGQQGNKTFQTRRRSALYYGNGNFCDMRCLNDWLYDFGNKAIDHFGRTTEVQHLTEEKAWYKDYDWRGNADESHRYYYRNAITKEQRSLTEEQYNNDNYTLNTI